jgi:hypothetical protein
MLLHVLVAILLAFTSIENRRGRWLGLPRALAAAYVSVLAVATVAVYALDARLDPGRIPWATFVLWLVALLFSGVASHRAVRGAARRVTLPG